MLSSLPFLSCLLSPVSCLPFSLSPCLPVSLTFRPSPYGPEEDPTWSVRSSSEEDRSLSEEDRSSSVADRSSEEDRYAVEDHCAEAART